MSLANDKPYRMKMRDVEAAFRYRRIPYPKRSVELIALLAISCTFFLFMHTNKLNSRLKEMEVKLQPSEFSALGLTADHHVGDRDAEKHEDMNSLHRTYQYLKSTGQLSSLSPYELNNTRKSQVDILFFNRCAKVGSESLLELLLKLELFNGFRLEREGLRKPAKRQLKPAEQRALARNIIDLGAGSVYIEHVNWLDFEQIGLPTPIYINLVRDPVERVISWFYYTRSAYKNAIEYRRSPNKPIRSAAWFKKDFNRCVRSGDPECQYIPFTVRDHTGDFKRQTLFFCGHHEDCLPFNSPTAVQLAKDHVERSFAVVGSWEDTNVTLTVFEQYIPRFFRGARLLFQIHHERIRNRNKNRRKPVIHPDVKEAIRRNFTYEYDFYYFCKQRLYKQFWALKNLK